VTIASILLASPVLAATTAAERAELICFVILAPVAVVTALGVVFNRNAVYSALLLVGNFFCLAAFYVLLQAQFLAAVQIIVYAGAIMVLFLFVLMLLGVERRELLREVIRGQRVTAAILGVVLLAGIITAVVTGVFPTGGAQRLAAVNADGNVRAVGRLLFTRYTLPFEATGVLLLVAGVGALVLGRRHQEIEAEEEAEAGAEAAATDGGEPA
jgi:NADH-quinone oxidoreductase subunit J